MIRDFVMYMTLLLVLCANYNAACTYKLVREMNQRSMNTGDMVLCEMARIESQQVQQAERLERIEKTVKPSIQTIPCPMPFYTMPVVTNDPVYHYGYDSVYEGHK